MLHAKHIVKEKGRSKNRKLRLEHSLPAGGTSGKIIATKVAMLKCHQCRWEPLLLLIQLVGRKSILQLAECKRVLVRHIHRCQSIGPISINQWFHGTYAQIAVSSQYFTSTFNGGLVCVITDGGMKCITKIIEWNTCEVYSWKIKTNNEFCVDETSSTSEIMWQFHFHLCRANSA